MYQFNTPKAVHINRNTPFNQQKLFYTAWQLLTLETGRLLLRTEHSSVLQYTNTRLTPDDIVKQAIQWLTERLHK